MKTFYIKIGEIVFSFDSERDLEIKEGLVPFLIEKEETPDVQVFVRWDYDRIRKPTTAAVGQDLIQTYYIEDEMKFCQTEGGPKGPVSQVVYSEDCKTLNCFINGTVYEQQYYSLSWILRLLPMREVFQRFGVVFFHGAQVAVGEDGILFTAPSETGKSTQAKLWITYENARLVCGDRTLVRKTDDKWRCYGYPIDGSSPVRSTEVTELKAIALLKQAKENHIECLRGGKALTQLMPQLVIDGWSASARQRSMELLLELLADVPAYQLSCTPDKEAVDVLKKRLVEDGMRLNGEDQRSIVK